MISWDLVSLVDYTAGNELEFNLHFKAPANTTAKKFYILGGLYTDTTYISGSLFGILKAAEVDYGVNSTTYISVWELDPEEEVELSCKFIINKSNCLLALFLMEMVGDEVDLNNDIEIAQISVQLVAPVPVSIFDQITPLISVAFLFGIIGIMMKGMFKK